MNGYRGLIAVSIVATLAIWWAPSRNVGSTDAARGRPSRSADIHWPGSVGPTPPPFVVERRPVLRKLPPVQNTSAMASWVEPLPGQPAWDD